MNLRSNMVTSITRGFHLSRSALTGCLFVVVLFLGGAGVEASESQAFVDWVSENLIAIENLDAPLESEKIDSLKKAIGFAQVVGLGESRHDTREQVLMKSLLVRHLVKNQGFRALFLEESYPHARAIDRYITTGEGDPRKLMNGLAGWYLWDTEEMLELVQWMRSFNKELEPDQQVRFFGMDITAPAPGVKQVIQYLEAAKLGEGLNETTLGLDLQEGDIWTKTWQRYGELPDARRTELGGTYKKLIETLEANQKALIASSSQREYEGMFLQAKVGTLGNALFSTRDQAKVGVIRENGMTHVTLSVLDGEMKGKRAILWAHNLHVAKSPFRWPGMEGEGFQPMGVLIDKSFGKKYVAISGAFGSGTYPATLPPGERNFEVAGPEVMDGALAEVGVPFFVADLRKAQGNEAVIQWLGQERQWLAQEAHALLVPTKAFDLIYFVKEISRSQPTPLALERYKSLGG